MIIPYPNNYMLLLESRVFTQMKEERFRQHSSDRIYSFVVFISSPFAIMFFFLKNKLKPRTDHPASLSVGSVVGSGPVYDFFEKDPI